MSPQAALNSLVRGGLAGHMVNDPVLGPISYYHSDTWGITALGRETLGRDAVIVAMELLTETQVGVLDVVAPSGRLWTGAQLWSATMAEGLDLQPLVCYGLLSRSTRGTGPGTMEYHYEITALGRRLWVMRTSGGGGDTSPQGRSSPPPAWRRWR
jgi:hypothetical protein